jgi:cell division protein FtsQ
MDGGRRLLRSLKGTLTGQPFARPAFAGLQDDARHGSRGAVLSSYSAFAPRPQAAGRRRSIAARPSAMRRFLCARATTIVLTMAFLGAVGLYGTMRGGQYDAFVAANGSPLDTAAKALGFGVDMVTIVGSRGLNEAEVLAATRITDRNSLLFLDLAEVRDRLRQIPLVKEVSVRKLYPDRLLIEITEREPFAIWQKDGKLLVVATDGTPIQELNDQRFTDLPFVVGKGANARVGEFLKIVDSAGDLRSRIRAGILVGERRWTLKMTTGLDVKLPENDPEEAIAQFARLARESRLLDKDLVSIDLRAPGRMYARLTEEAAAVRAEAFARFKKKGGAT